MDKDASIYCCIDGCQNGGAIRLSGRLYCRAHYEEEFGERRPCEVPQCDVAGCENAAMVQQAGTGRWFCIDHAWESERVDRHGLRHPPTFTELDRSFLQSIGVTLDGDMRENKKLLKA